ncbi:MAG: hypothetical protein WC509_06260 [Candidatus Izemoplasmatales bacterium]
MQQYAEGFVNAVAGHRSKRWLVLAVLLFLSSASGIAYSLWDISRAEVDPTIDIGVGTVLTVSETIDPADGTTLIPYGAFKGPGDVDECVFVYRVSLNKPGRLVVAVTQILVGGVPDAGIVETAVYGDAGDDGTTPFAIVLSEDGDAYVATIRLRVRLSDKATDAEYLAIQGRPIRLTLSFTAESLVS